MTRLIPLSLISFCISCSGPKQNMSSAKIDSFTDDSLHLVSKQFVFTEGPAVDQAGNIFFTDQPRNQIWKYDTEGKLSLFMDSSGRANGLYIGKDGSVIACADKENELWSISKGKDVTVKLKGAAGKAFNGPNDLWIDAMGGIYFTDPYYQRDYWTRKSGDLPFQGLFYLAPGTSEALLLDSTMERPNGIVGTGDGKFLYVADIGAGRTYRYAISAPGKLTDRQLFIEKGSDGMTLDAAGNLYISGKGVTAYSAAGKEVWHLPVPSAWVGNLCFGGAARTLLFITASESVYAIRMNVRGIE